MGDAGNDECADESEELSSSEKSKGYQLSWHIKNPLIHINMLYAYIANVCVAKFARRQGIASNIIHLAANMAALEGFKQLFVHVNADNIPGQELYQKHSFK
ncbi:hypothetical protein MTR67_023710, partial [Solanum verrucosum]